MYNTLRLSNTLYNVTSGSLTLFAVVANPSFWAATEVAVEIVDACAPVPAWVAVTFVNICKINVPMKLLVRSMAALAPY